MIYSDRVARLMQIILAAAGEDIVPALLEVEALVMTNLATRRRPARLRPSSRARMGIIRLVKPVTTMHADQSRF